jgi:hypothetical protein
MQRKAQTAIAPPRKFPRKVVPRPDGMESSASCSHLVMPIEATVTFERSYTIRRCPAPRGCKAWSNGHGDTETPRNRKRVGRQLDYAGGRLRRLGDIAPSICAGGCPARPAPPPQNHLARTSETTANFYLRFSLLRVSVPPRPIGYTGAR